MCFGCNRCYIHVHVTYRLFVVHFVYLQTSPSGIILKLDCLSSLCDDYSDALKMIQAIDLHMTLPWNSICLALHICCISYPCTWTLIETSCEYVLCEAALRWKSWPFEYSLVFHINDSEQVTQQDTLQYRELLQRGIRFCLVCNFLMFAHA